MRLGAEMAESLRQLIKPYFLRRTKAEVLQDNNSECDGEIDKENCPDNRQSSARLMK